MDKERGNDLKHFIMGTAGHKGHGKTALIRALTGTHSSQEIRDARMRFDETLLEIVDLPDESDDFGALTACMADVDMVLLAVAADEGITAQALLHLKIMSLLNLSRCIVVLTKTDQLDAMQLAAAREAVLALYEQGLPRCAPIVEVSASTGAGVEHLVETIVEQCALMPIHRCERPFYMHVSTSFLQASRFFARGIVREGRVCAGDTVMFCPSSEQVRVLAVHEAYGESQAGAGQRVTLELSLPQEDAVFSDTALSAVLPDARADILDVRLMLSPERPHPLAPETEILVYVGTAQTVCRVYLPKNEPLFPGSHGYGQLLPLSPMSALTGEHFVLCLPALDFPVGGGTILDAHVPEIGMQGDWRRAAMRMSCYEHGARDGQLHWEANATICTEEALRRRFIRWSEEEFSRCRDSLLTRGLLVRAGELLLSAQLAGALKGGLIARLTQYHAQNPMGAGLPLSQAYALCPQGLLALCMQDGTVRVANDCLSLPLFYPDNTTYFGQIAEILLCLSKEMGRLPLHELIAQSGLPEREAEIVARHLAQDEKLCLDAETIHYAGEGGCNH